MPLEKRVAHGSSGPPALCWTATSAPRLLHRLSGQSSSVSARETGMRLVAAGQVPQCEWNSPRGWRPYGPIQGWSRNPWPGQACGIECHFLASWTRACSLALAAGGGAGDAPPPSPKGRAKGGVFAQASTFFAREVLMCPDFVYLRAY